MAFDRRLTRLRALVDRLERLPASATTLRGHELLWLEDPSRVAFAEPGDGSTGVAGWKRGLRG